MTKTLRLTGFLTLSLLLLALLLVPSVSAYRVVSTVVVPNCEANEATVSCQTCGPYVDDYGVAVWTDPDRKGGSLGTGDDEPLDDTPLGEEPLDGESWDYPEVGAKFYYGKNCQAQS